MVFFLINIISSGSLSKLLFSKTTFSCPFTGSLLCSSTSELVFFLITITSSYSLSKQFLSMAMFSSPFTGTQVVWHIDLQLAIMVALLYLTGYPSIPIML